MAIVELNELQMKVLKMFPKPPGHLEPDILSFPRLSTIKALERRGLVSLSMHREDNIHADSEYWKATLTPLGIALLKLN